MEGLFREGKFLHGVINLKNGTVYEGSVTDMKKNGKGMLKKQDGSLYKGYFLNDEFHGHGILELNGTKYEG